MFGKVKIQYKAKDIQNQCMPEWLYHEEFDVIEITDKYTTIKLRSYVYTVKNEYIINA